MARLLLNIIWLIIGLEMVDPFSIIDAVPTSYGPYVIEVVNITACTQYQKKNISIYDFGINVVNNTQIGWSNITILEDIRSTMKETVKLWILKDGKFVKIATAVYDNTCLSPAIVRKGYKKFVNFISTKGGCYVKAGNVYTTIGPNEMAHGWFGNNLFYGRIKVHSTHTTKLSCYVCMIAIFDSKRI